jgi:glycosyltransferase involved in cell wall biosynthesis
MNDNPLISIIVPVYNAEKYLGACIESITSQTYKNLEIILIDDGSSDNSGKICDDYAEKDNRIRVIHKENGGVSKARNDGLKLVSGEYIGFVDSDDTISPKMFESLFKNLSENSADIAVCDYEMVYADRRVSVNPRGISMKFSAEESIKNVLLGKYFQGHLCNKLFKASVLKDIFFDEDIYVYEDMLVVIKALLKSKSVFFDSTPYYDYYMRDDSAFHTSFTYKRYSAHTACERVFEAIASSDIENKEELLECAHATTLICNTVFLQKLYHDKSARGEFCKLVRGNIKKSFSFKNIKKLTMMQRAGVVLARIGTPVFFMFVPLKERLK